MSSRLKKGFKEGCRPLVCLDGCFSKETYRGIDLNDCMFPFAFALMKVESNANWKWFIELIKEDLQIYNSYQWIFMSDRQKEGTSVYAEIDFTGGQYSAKAEAIPTTLFDVPMTNNDFRPQFDATQGSTISSIDGIFVSVILSHIF
ncbi:uncharacterized protein LOC125370698 [Ricinus communis]|uniref:uncharacterized protein LOC125370698 n=1 Tax=Ricinus communis TaxID=3988 RepID=UPI00201A66AA|nr:uncharacterized protein LOC125370698 [Ricinus communis]